MKDSSGREWTKEEIQALTTQVGSLNKVKSRLGLKNSKVLRDLGIQTPSEFVQSRAKSEGGVQWLTSLVIRHGSLKKAAKHLNVSVTTVRNVLKEIGVELEHKKPTREEAIEAMQKFGSPIMAARILDTTVSEVKKVLPNDEWKNYRDPTKAGDHAVRTGALGEIYFESQRGDKITKSCSKHAQNHPDYDCEDAEFGKVNVKASVLSNPKKGKPSWVWEVSPTDKVDSYVLVLMDRTKTCIGWILFQKHNQAILEEMVGAVNGQVGMPVLVHVSRLQNGNLAIRMNDKLEI